MAKGKRPRTLEIHGVPMDLGANLRGVEMGPSALLIAGIAPALERLGYEVTLTDQLEIKSRVNLPPDESNAKYLHEIVAACERVAELSEQTLSRGAIPVFLGGDHSIAAGTVAGAAAYHRSRGADIGLIWFDAHADMNTPATSPSGNVHGMPLSTLVGLGPKEMAELGGWSPKVRPEHVVIVGARDIDDSERNLVRDSGVTVYSMALIDKLGMAQVTKEALQIAGKGTAGVYLSFDIDGLDPSFAPGVGTPVRGGVSFREAHLFMEMIAESGKLLGLDIVELNPIADTRNETAEAVVHLVQSAFGRRIYYEVGRLADGPERT